MFFRKRPVTVEAWYVKDLIISASKDWKSLPKCVADAYEKGMFVFCPDHISIHTLEGPMRAEVSDIVIKGVKGEFYTCKPDIFQQTYENAAPEAVGSPAN